ncbi:hypothetical protein B0T26DRAFT_751786 [Lasiosphaeria miniovina]|uniref:Uncharacterized protein n=1 Tax=Lasiosphaeria miniovina TaxID=1954250 RepID=A0AA40AKZ7_9PEZI|nr:uncharacterized protein B0T26DRAFT_751786 [Lasiosphaeria miniovina]KAK0717759.1 hypothetical protein B0T26DRAFT_751786 [Lasiosphaeria miniovina]
MRDDSHDSRGTVMSIPLTPRYDGYNDFDSRISYSSGFVDQSMDYEYGNYYSNDSQASAAWSPSFNNGQEYESLEKKYIYLVLGCRAKPLSWLADLDRHYKGGHLPISQKYKYTCDYRKCACSTHSGGNSKPGSSKDSSGNLLRRGIRRARLLPQGPLLRSPTRLPQDPLKRSSSKGSHSPANWLKDRYIDLKWWRCSKCLQRVYVSSDGWECRDCKVMC